jgi:hypothetical protein
LIYKKTSYGQEEVANPRRSIGLKERQLLIMVDGKRSAEDLGKFISLENIKDALEFLAKLGFIMPAHIQEPSKTNGYTTTNSQTLNLSANQINSIKEHLLKSTDEHLGILGRSLRRKIEIASSDEDMKVSISQWHMAMRESKSGRDIAHVLMDEVKVLIHANN